MKTTRRKFSASFKAKVAIEEIKEFILMIILKKTTTLYLTDKSLVIISLLNLLIIRL